MNAPFQHINIPGRPLYSQFVRRSLEARARLIAKQPMWTVGRGTGAMWNGLHPDALKPRRILGADVLRIVSEVTGVSRHDLQGPYRPRYITRARQIAYFLMRQYTHLSTSQIGKLFGSKDHSTVVHGCNVVRDNPDLFQPFFNMAIQRLAAIVVE